MNCGRTMVFSDYYDLALQESVGEEDYCFSAPITGIGGGRL